jgi:chitinase
MAHLQTGSQVSEQDLQNELFSNLHVFLVSACSGAGSGTTAAPTTTKSVIPTTTTAQGSTTTTSSAPTSSPTTGTGTCGTVAAWASTAVYKAGDQVAYKGQIYKAGWWTLNDIPGGSTGVWTVVGPCSAKSKFVPTVAEKREIKSPKKTRGLAKRDNKLLYSRKLRGGVKVT